MLCPKCATEINDTAHFCPSCGASTKAKRGGTVVLPAEGTPAKSASGFPPPPPGRGGTVVLDPEPNPAGVAPPSIRPLSEIYPPPSPSIPFAAVEAAPPSPAGPPRHFGAPLSPAGPPRPPARRPRGKEYIYTILGFIFLAVVIAAGARYAIDAWSRANTPRNTPQKQIADRPPEAIHPPHPSDTPEQEQARREASTKIKELQARAENSARERAVFEKREAEAHQAAEQAQREKDALAAQAEQEKMRRVEADRERARVEEVSRQQRAAAQLEAQRQDEAIEKARRDALEAAAALARQQQQDAAPVYRGPKFGQIVWQGVARPGDEIHIDDSGCSSGQIISGRLPGVLVQVDPASNQRGRFQIVNTPNALNNFRKVSFRVLQVRGSGPLTVTLTWNIP